METEEALHILKRHNIWRRGADVKPTNPEQLGKALDKAIEVLGSDVGHTKKQLPTNEELEKRWKDLENSGLDKKLDKWD